MIFYATTLFFTLLFNLFLGVFVLSKNFKSLKNKTLALFEACIAIWSLGMLIMTLAFDKQMAFTGIRILHFALFFSFAVFFSFVIVITNDQSKINKKICFVGFILGLIFNIIDRIKPLAIVSDVTFVFETYQPVAGLSAYFFNLVFLSFMSYGTYLLYKKYKISESLLEKSRIKCIFVGMFTVVLFSLPNILLVMGLKIYPLAHLGLNLYALLVTYSIVKYKFLDVEIIIQKGIVYFILTALVTLTWLLVVFAFEGPSHSQSLFVRILTIVVIVLIFQPIRERVQLIVDKKFYRERYNLQNLLRKISEDISTIIKKDTLFSLFLKTIKDTIHPEYVTVMLADDTNGLCKIEAFEGSFKDVTFNQDEPIIKWFKREKRELLKDEIEENPKFNGARESIIRTIEELRIVISIPLLFKEKLVGMVNLGPKLSKQAYNNDELFFLITLSSELAMALANTKLYSQLKNYTLELENTARKLKIANEIKSDFLSVVSHELCTPLTIITGYLNLFSSKILGELTKEQLEGVEILLEKSKYLNELIGNILDLSKIEQGKKYKLIKQVVDMKKLVEEIVRMFSKAAQDKKIILQSQIDPDIPLIMSDLEKVKEVFIKLVDNAIEYASKEAGGRVTINLEDKGGYLQASVEDTGIGIAKEKQEKIFERFYQIDMKDNREYKGVGLGLPIVKEIIEALDGTIMIESKENEGSKFIFTIPKEEVKKETLSKIELKKKKLPQGAKILIADDDEDILRLLELYLKSRGYEVKTARDGLRALEKLYEEEIDLIIFNLKLPKVDGYEFAHILKSHEETKDIFLIMLLSREEEANLEKIYKSGATSHLFKPFSFDYLVEKISNLG